MPSTSRNCESQATWAVQAGIAQTGLGSYSGAEVTEAYDEPLSMAAMAGEDGIAAPFFA